MDAADVVVRTSALSKTYDGTNVVDAIDLAVPANSVFGFLGPNGAGKTTTMKVLLGLIRPTSGSGSIFGLDIATQARRCGAGSATCRRNRGSIRT